MQTVFATRSTKLTALVLVLALAGIILNACSPLAAPQTTPLPTDAPLPNTGGERLAEPIPDPWNPREGEIPGALLEEIISDLVNRIGADRSQVEVLAAQSVTYNDGSMGCPDPATSYIMAEVEGYRVILYVDAIEYDYRVADSGYFIFCDSPQP